MGLAPAYRPGDEDAAGQTRPCAARGGQEERRQGQGQRPTAGQGQRLATAPGPDGSCGPQGQQERQRAAGHVAVQVFRQRDRGAMCLDPQSQALDEVELRRCASLPIVGQKKVEADGSCQQPTPQADPPPGRLTPAAAGPGYRDGHCNACGDQTEAGPRHLAVIRGPDADQRRQNERSSQSERQAKGLDSQSSGPHHKPHRLPGHADRALEPLPAIHPLEERQHRARAQRPLAGGALLPVFQPLGRQASTLTETANRL